MSNESQEEVQKKYDPKDTTLKFVQRRDDLDPLGSDDDDDSLRAEMSCGHAVTPNSLTLWCRSQLDEGNYKFRCPALAEGTKLCNKLWSYKEVRRLADLSVEEMEHFEETMARLAASEYCEFQSCPQCRTSVERKDLSNLCVKCTICTADRKKTYQFCWQCHKEWKGPGPRSDRCNNDGCINKDLELLQTCKTIDLPEVEGVTDCPSVRACPYKICPSGVAPRQTSMPVKWNRSEAKAERSCNVVGLHSASTQPEQEQNDPQLSSLCRRAAAAAAAAALHTEAVNSAKVKRSNLIRLDRVSFSSSSKLRFHWMNIFARLMSKH